MKIDSEILGSEDCIQESANPESGTLILACTMGDDYDNQKNRVILIRNDEEIEFGASGSAVVSIDTSTNGLAYVLMEDGPVVEFNWKMPKNQDDLKSSRKLFLNDEALENGPLRRIRIIGGEVVCGGTCGQMYHLTNGKFRKLPTLVCEGEEPMIKDFIGTSINDFIAVTVDGYAAHFDGNKWTILDLPTNSALHGICLTQNGEYAYAGYESTFAIGNADKWKIIDSYNHENEIDYYGIASLGDKIYAAHLGGLDVFDGEALTRLASVDDSDLEFVYLRSGVDGVWACAGHTIGLINESGWHRYA